MFHKWQVGKRLFWDPQMHQNPQSATWETFVLVPADAPELSYGA